METKNLPRITWALIAILCLSFSLSLAWLTYGNYQAETAANPDKSSLLWNLVVSTLLLAIPVGLLYASIGVLVTAARQHAALGQLSPRLAKWIYWSPRLAGIIIILFVSLFALDVFDSAYTPWEIVVGLFMHLLPSIFMTIVLVLAWRWEWVGFFSFLLAAIYFLRFLIGNPLQEFSIVLLFSGPLFLIALLFGANWRWRKDLRPGPKPAAG